MIRPHVGAMIGEPSAAAPVNAVRPDGTAKFAWFGRLKHSALNSRRRPPNANALTSATSTEIRPGPMTELRGALPRWFVGGSEKQLISH